MVSLALLANIFSEQPPLVALLPKRCLRKRLNTNQCQLCLDACPSGALSLAGREVALNQSTCSGCMSCVASCPQDALVCDYDLDELLCTLQEDRDVLISCVRQTQCQPDEITVACVGIFSRQMLAAIVAGGCGSVTFNMIGCSECCNRDASTAFVADCQMVIETLSHIQPSGLVVAHQNEQLQNNGVGRRLYLANIRKIIADATKKSFTSDRTTPVQEKGTDRRVPYKTKLISNLIIGLEEESRTRILSLFGKSLSVNGECTCCPLCKGICPTGAIKIERSEQGKKLQFEMLDCSGCGLCVEFCKSGCLLLERFT